MDFSDTFPELDCYESYEISNPTFANVSDLNSREFDHNDEWLRSPELPTYGYPIFSGDNAAVHDEWLIHNNVAEQSVALTPTNSEPSSPQVPNTPSEPLIHIICDQDFTFDQYPNGMHQVNLSHGFLNQSLNISGGRFLPVDMTKNLREEEYNEIFNKYRLALLVDKLPLMNEYDLVDVEENGRMYFLRNVKRIVPKVGPWKFNAHIGSKKDERQYNIPGKCVTCKVKEWIEDGVLWRLYHFKKGNYVKPK